jgi:hypothetical protein
MMPVPVNRDPDSEPELTDQKLTAEEGSELTPEAKKAKRAAYMKEYMKKKREEKGE